MADLTEANESLPAEIEKDQSAADRQWQQRISRLEARIEYLISDREL
jgi:hypothetical protein